MNLAEPRAILALLPHTTTIDPAGQLTLAGRRLADLAQQFGTPLYVYDLATIQAQIEAYRRALTAYPGPSRLTYASKAFLCPALARFMSQAGLGFDVASAGEIFIAQRGGADPAGMHLHGNNKSCTSTLVLIFTRSNRSLRPSPGYWI
jgi:diaminopimelate decarboxylase